MLFLNSIPSGNGLILLLIAINFISTLCVDSPKADENNVEDKNNSQPIVPTMNDQLNEYMQKNDDDHSNKNDDSSVRAEKSSVQSMSFESRKSSNSAHPAVGHAQGIVSGRRLTMLPSDLSSSSNSIGVHSTDQEDLNAAYEFLIKDWETLPEAKNESNITKIDEEHIAESSDQQNVGKDLTSSIIGDANIENEIHEEAPKLDESEEIGHKSAKNNARMEMYEQNAKLIEQLNRDQSTNETDKNGKEKTIKHGKSASLINLMADKFKLFRANSNSKMPRSKSVNENNNEKESFQNSPKIIMEKHSDNAESSAAKSNRMPPSSPSPIVNTLNEALAHHIVHQKQSQQITEWKCASKYRTKYLTHFFRRNEQVALCKAWARVDAKVSELLDAWKALSEFPHAVLHNSLMTDKFQVEVGGQTVDINQIFDHLQMAHQCIFGAAAANAVEAKQCQQNAKILNANEWDKQIKQFKNAAKMTKATAVNKVS
ncbi:hypothetical protein niasHS_005107 [Heterodera schachtii]|uniref:Uncharacterized protein n=1 Tax=Heterodera schachtii TaxID=97005 RepID=A0ABD2JLX2_HETSC